MPVLKRGNFPVTDLGKFLCLIVNSFKSLPAYLKRMLFMAKNTENDLLKFLWLLVLFYLLLFVGGIFLLYTQYPSTIGFTTFL